MMAKTNEILDLMNKNWIYEAIITTTDPGGSPRASPIGISTPDSERIILEIYKTSKTSENITLDKKFIINFVMYVEIFWNATIHENLEFDNFGHLKDSDAWLEMEVEDVEDAGEKIKIYSKISDYEIKKPGVALINRAKYLAMESIIKFTKPDSSKAEDEINENLRVIKKVAPGSKYEKIVKEILNKIKTSPL